VKVILDFEESVCRVEREDGPKIYDESILLFAVKCSLRAQGHDVIKKLMWKDGHLVSESQHYIRTRKAPTSDSYDQSRFMIWDTEYAIRRVTEPYNEDGVVILGLIW